MSWVVYVFNENDWEETGEVQHVIVGPFQEEVRADEVAQRIADGYPALRASVHWAFSWAHKDPLKDELEDLSQIVERSS